MSDLTRMLEAVQAGQANAADELLPLVYGELRRLAAARMAQERPGQTLQPTALVHEAWLRLGGDGEARWENRAHFFAAAAEAMRRVLIDQARRKQALRHGGGWARVELEGLDVPEAASEPMLLRVSEALENLARDDTFEAMTQTEKAARFRALHERDSAFLMPNPWDAGSARVLEGLGFEALATSSAAFAATLGRQDGNVSRDEALSHSRQLVQVTSVPIAADLENGFGDGPAKVAETIRLAAETGLVGGSIEDAPRGRANARRLDRGRPAGPRQRPVRPGPRDRSCGGRCGCGARPTVPLHAYGPRRELRSRQTRPR
jgi:RNA polymerase sigma factor (TIGR02999 family)